MTRVRLAITDCGGVNVAAFMDMIAYAEGVERFSQDAGYNVLVGGALFDSYADHPRKVVTLRKYGIKSTAAGRYQFLSSTWDDCRVRLGGRVLPDFSPVSQDRACVLLLRQCGAFSFIRVGRFNDAVNAARAIWASLPGAGYGQRELSAEALRAVYLKAGGTEGAST